MGLSVKQTKKKKTKKKVSKLEPPKLMNPGDYSVVLSSDEVVSLIQILSFSKGVFQQMATQRQVDGDDKSSQVYASRSKLSTLLYEKFRDIAGIGEPLSRELH